MKTPEEINKMASAYADEFRLVVEEEGWYNAKVRDFTVGYTAGYNTGHKEGYMMNIKKENNTNNFTADKARDLALNDENSVFHKILENIKKEAKKGNYELSVDQPCNPTIITELKNRGFDVYKHEVDQRQSIYYTIKWNK
jgi:hypothetical protein